MFGTITLDGRRGAIVASRSLLLVSGQDLDSLSDQASRGCPGQPSPKPDNGAFAGIGAWNDTALIS
jgi:hypothetical protein